MHTTLQSLYDPDSNQLREMWWSWGTARAVQIVEGNDKTQVIGGIW